MCKPGVKTSDVKTAVSDMLISWRGLKGDFAELYLLHLIYASEK